MASSPSSSQRRAQRSRLAQPQGRAAAPGTALRPTSSGTGSPKRSPDAQSLRESRVIKKLQPPQKGSQHWERQYGDALVCVRYREDARRGFRYTTVEVVVGTRQIDREAHHFVLVPIGAFDESKRQRAIELGAKWKRRDKGWLMTLDVAIRLGLLHHLPDTDDAHS